MENDCRKCGECCTDYTIYGVLDEEMFEFLKAHYAVKELYDIGFTIPHRCKMLDESNLCKIYENRPKKCKEWICKKDFNK